MKLAPLVLLAALSFTSSAAAAPGPTIRRYALIASSNDGGPGRPTLRFADSDARAMAEVLRQLGGLRDEDLLLMPAVTRKSFETGLQRLKQSLAQTPPGRLRRELFVYYSGHSDEEGLLLGKERLPYLELRRWIDEAGADVKIAVLDSCSSGALIRRKGGVHRAPFLSDQSTDARGHAFLTASSADEAAQESERLGAAFFTHFLISGLRGAADRTRDGRVTLNEAYEFAFDETLGRTQRTAAGAQHPNYDIHLAGAGDLVMTDLRATNASLVLEERVAGRVFVRDSNGRLLVELRKEPVYPVELGLGPGHYRVYLDADGRAMEAAVTLVEGKRARLTVAQFTPVTPLVATRRGDDTTLVAATEPESYRHVPFDLVLAPGMRISGDGPVVHNFSLGLIGHSEILRGLQLSIGGNVVEEEMSGGQIAVGYNLARGLARGFQIAAGVNVTQGQMRGIQIASFANVASGGLRGAQTGIVNHARGDVRGAQIGVGSWLEGDLRGTQVNVLNVAKGEVRGTQIGTVNFARQLRGPQIAVLNVGGQVEGLQLGVVNVASRVRGLQLGVVNVADDVQGASVGLLSLVRNGYHALSVWSSDLMVSNVGLKLGSRHVYALLGFGLDRTDDDRALMSAIAGLGVHATPGGGRFFLDVDAISSQFGTTSDWTDEYDSTTATLRVMAGWRLLPHLAITAGPTLNVNVFERGARYVRGLDFGRWTVEDGETVVRLSPGFVAGLQL